MNDDSAHDYKSYVDLSMKEAIAREFDRQIIDSDSVQNPSGILPTGYKVLVMSEDGETAKEMKRIGLQIADITKERDTAGSVIGKLIAVSPLAFTYHDPWPSDEHPQVGVRVVYGKYSGTLLTGKDGEEYRIITDQDIIAVLEF